VKITSVKAAERFDNTKFSNEVVDGRALSIYAAYTCPQCGVRIGFQKDNFERALRQDRTNLTPGVARCFDEFAREYLRNLRDYLDWICPSCGLATRVYIQYWAGGKHGDHGIDLIAVIETPIPSPTIEVESVKS
jgi:rubredoxin